MISKQVVKMLNDQINKEFESAYIYQGMEMYLGNEHCFSGIENFFHVQVQEELAHARLMIDYVHRLGGNVELQAIPQPSIKYESILHVFETALEHEKKVTAWIDEIMDVAVKEKDYASQDFLKYFITEQLEEEESFVNHIDLLKFINNSPQGLMMFDQKLANRTFVPPTL